MTDTMKQEVLCLAFLTWDLRASALVSTMETVHVHSVAVYLNVQTPTVALTALDGTHS